MIEEQQVAHTDGSVEQVQVGIVSLSGPAVLRKVSVGHLLKILAIELYDCVARVGRLPINRFIFGTRSRARATTHDPCILLLTLIHRFGLACVLLQTQSQCLCNHFLFAS